MWGRTKESSPQSTMPMPRSPVPSRRSRNGEDERTIGTRCLRANPHKDNRSTISRDELSPLSPTFGPRKGLVPSGTVDRRRKLPRYLPTLDRRLSSKSGTRDIEPHSAPVITTKQPIPNAIFIHGDEDQKILWEPGWSYVECNSDPCVEKFEEARCTTVIKEDNWLELVALLGLEEVM